MCALPICRVEKSVDIASGYAAVGANCAIVAPVAHTQQRDGSACRNADVHFIAPKGVSIGDAGAAYLLERLLGSQHSFDSKADQPRDCGSLHFTSVRSRQGSAQPLEKDCPSTWESVC